MGLGYDSHRFDRTRPLILGGVSVPGHPGLAGHSDGDAVCHALTDAVLGAAGLGDIGALYPPEDPTWEGADSLELLRGAMERVHASGYRLANADVVVVTERPRIGPLAQEMGRKLADAMAVDASRVSVKGKSNEGLGWIGAGEGLAVHAVAALARA